MAKAVVRYAQERILPHVTVQRLVTYAVLAWLAQRLVCILLGALIGRLTRSRVHIGSLALCALGLNNIEVETQRRGRNYLVKVRSVRLAVSRSTRKGDGDTQGTGYGINLQVGEVKVTMGERKAGVQEPEAKEQVAKKKQTKATWLVNLKHRLITSFHGIAISFESLEVILERFAVIGSDSLAATFVWSVKDLKAALEIGGSTDDHGVLKHHREWFGKSVALKFRTRISWEEIAGSVADEKAQKREAGTAAAAKILSVDASSFNVTSSWLPATSLLAPPRPASSSKFPPPRDPNDRTVVVEASLGCINLAVDFETLENIIRIFVARPRARPAPKSPKAAGKAKAEDKDDACNSLFIRGLPRYAVTLHLGGLDWRIEGPKTPRVRTYGYGEPGDPFTTSWRHPDHLHVSFPSASMSLTGYYSDRSVQRGPAERRAAAKLAMKELERARAGSVVTRVTDRVRGRSVALSDSEEEEGEDEEGAEVDEAGEESVASSSTAAAHDDLGAPPPAPLNSRPVRARRPRAPRTNLAEDLDTHPFQFNVKLDFAAEVFRIQLYHHPKSGFGAGGDPQKLDIFALGEMECSARLRVRGLEERDMSQGPLLDLSTRKGDVDLLIGIVAAELWRPVVMGTLKDFVDLGHEAAMSSRRRQSVDVDPATMPSSAGPTAAAEQDEDDRPVTPLADMLPKDVSISICMTGMELRVAGIDPQADLSAPRGVVFMTGPVLTEYFMLSKHRRSTSNFPDRSSLELREDIRVEANSLRAEDPNVAQALLKLSVSDCELQPIVNARTGQEGYESGRKRRNPSISGPTALGSDWELRGRESASRRMSLAPQAANTAKAVASTSVFVVPSFTTRLRLKALPPKKADASGEPQPVDHVTVMYETDAITARIDLFHIYLCLLAVSTIGALVSPPPGKGPPLRAARPPKKRATPQLALRAELNDLHVFLTLPHDVKLYAHLRRPKMQVSPTIGTIAEWDSLLIAGISPTVPDKWDELFRLRVTTLEIRPKAVNDGYHSFAVAVAAESLRIRIPFRYVVSQIIDNAASMVKAIKQLVHQLIKRKQTFMLTPEPEDAKRLPEISISIKMFAIEMQDDPFETKLNIIWRAGVIEQAERLERQAAFEEKVEAIQRSHAEVDPNAPPEEAEDGQSPRGHKFTSKSSVSIGQARERLKEYDSHHWAKRMRNAIAEQSRREDALSRRLYSHRYTTQRADTRLPVEMLGPSRTAPLCRLTLQGVHIGLSKPSFGEEGLSKFLHDVGKGVPENSKFSLLVPLHLSWKMDEARCQLRDYPLPLLNLPPLAPGSGEERKCWEFESDVVIAEEMGDEDSVRRVPCPVIPAHISPESGKPYFVVVPRTAMPVKTYATPVIKVGTHYATRIGWGNAMQPAIQDVVRVIDTLSKPTPDPSDRLGFWDKIRLQLHWRIKILFDGPVHLHLKGTRDPYSLNGFGTGFAKAWRGQVRFLVGCPNPDNEFFQIESEEYVLGIPNLQEYVDNAASGNTPEATDYDDRSTHAGSGPDGVRGRHQKDADFVKVCAKFIDGVRWGMGAFFERTCDKTCRKPECQDKSPFHRQCRIFEFEPHWTVRTKSGDSIKPGEEISDSFAGFRSNFIHFSISITSPLSLPLPSSVKEPEMNMDGVKKAGHNSLYLSPMAFSHFWAWWRTFDGTMSLPIRQGKLFPSAQASSKKFGKHCATIKYRFSLAPLFISHTYRQESWAEWKQGTTTVLGLKGKIGRFNVDLHQREQEETVKKPEFSDSKTVLHKAFYQAEVDCDGVDLRAIQATFREVEKSEIVPDSGEDDEEADFEPTFVSDTISDEDMEWIDLNDFMDANYSIKDPDPGLRLLPIMLCPRFTYYRQTPDVSKEVNRDDAESDVGVREVQGDAPAKTKFGAEPSHTCLMGCAPDPLSVQLEGAKLRLVELEQQLAEQEKGKQRSDRTLESRIAGLKKVIAHIITLRDTVADTPPRSESPTEDEAHDSKAPRERPPYGKPRPAEDSGEPLPHLSAALYDDWENWTNRYMVHNPVIQISNVTRDILLKYYFSSRERKGFVYHASASVLRFIRELQKERDKRHRRDWSRRKSMRTGSKVKKGYMDDNTTRLLEELVNAEGGKFWASSESAEDRRNFGAALDTDPEEAGRDLPDEFDLRPAHLCMLIQPQIALQSNRDDKSTIMITAFRTQVKAYSINDLRVIDDPVNAVVLHQTYGVLEGMQVFYPTSQARRQDVQKPFDFVPIETLVDLRADPHGFERVVPRTSAALRYDKFNQLRMSVDGPRGKHDEVNPHYFGASTDRISVECDKFSVSANPDHFAAIYNVVTDLLLYSDPLQKSRSKQLERMVFTHNFSNLREVAETVTGLQRRIREATQLLQLYQTHDDELDENGRMELFARRADFVTLSNELNFFVLALTRAQQADGVTGAAQKPAAGMQMEARAQELVWHMRDETDTPFAKLSVSGVEFSWLSKQDSSISNRLVIGDLRALNSSPDSIFPEVIAKHEGGEHELAKLDIFAALMWNALPAVGGISIVEQFEVHIHPIKLQLEHQIGRKIMDYIFAQRRRNVQEAIASKEQTSSSRSSVYGSPTLFAKSAESLGIGGSPRPASIRSSSNTSILSESMLGSSLRTNATSVMSVASASANRLKRVVSSDILSPQQQEESLDADEMRTRAALYRTFVLVDFTSTVLYLTYRSEKEDHSRLPDVYNITYKTPSIQYRSKTWSFLDLLDELKKDVIKSVWSQKGALIGQLLSKAHRKLPLQQTRSNAKRSLKNSLKNRLGNRSQSSLKDSSSSSPLRLTVSKASQGDGASSPGEAGEVESDDSSSEEDSPVIEGSRFTEEPSSLSSTSLPNIHVVEEDEDSDEQPVPAPQRRPSNGHAPEQKSLPAPRPRTLSGLSSSRAAHSLPALDEALDGAEKRRKSSGKGEEHVGYPVHHALHEQSTDNDGRKASLLMGKAYE